jgi:hypothetical protein
MPPAGSRFKAEAIGRATIPDGAGNRACCYILEAIESMRIWNLVKSRTNKDKPKAKKWNVRTVPRIALVLDLK